MTTNEFHRLEELSRKNKVMLAALKAAWEIRMINPAMFRAAHPDMSETERKVVEATEQITAAIALAEGRKEP